jgi:hypothetical protein
MSSKLKAVPDDIEELAAKARLAREEKCKEEITRILEEYKCELGVFVQVGEQIVPLAQVLSLPLQMLVRSKQA